MTQFIYDPIGHSIILLHFYNEEKKEKIVYI